MNEQVSLKAAGLVGIMLASSLTIMVGCALVPALPEIGAHFQVGNYAGWLVTMPALGVVLGAVPCSRVLNKIGAYKTCAAGLILYGLLGIGGFVMPGAISEFADRFLLGIATALVMTSSTALISMFYQGKKQLKMLAVQGMTIELGGVVFLSIGGRLAEISWHMPYFIYSVAFAALLLLLFFVPCITESHIGEAEHGNADARGSEETGIRHIAPVVLLAFLGMLVFFTAIVSLPTYLQEVKGYSTTFTGHYLAMISLVAVVFAGVMPKMVETISAKWTLAAAFACYAVAQSVLHAGSTTVSLYVAAVIMGIGFGFSTPLINSLTVERSTAANKARNLSFYSMCTFLGQFVSAFFSSTAGSHAFLAAAVLAAATCIGIAVLFRQEQEKKAAAVQHGDAVSVPRHDGRSI